MLDRSTSNPASIFRATRAPARAETFLDLVTIELSGHKGLRRELRLRGRIHPGADRCGPDLGRAERLLSGEQVAKLFELLS